MSVGTLYRGGEGMWTWVVHRITGVGVFFFLLVHVLDTALALATRSRWGRRDRSR